MGRAIPDHRHIDYVTFFYEKLAEFTTKNQELFNDGIENSLRRVRNLAREVQKAASASPR